MELKVIFMKMALLLMNNDWFHDLKTMNSV